MHDIFANIFGTCAVLFVLSLVLRWLDVEDLAGWVGGAAFLAGLTDLAVWAIYWLWS